MTEAVAEITDAPNRKRGPLLGALAALILGAAGFGSTYFGLWSPTAMMESGHDAGQESPIAAVEFVDVPTIVLPIPGAMRRSVVLSASIETDATHRESVEYLMPRVSDVFTAFLSQIDPKAYDKRGVLEIIRAELVTRTRYVLGEKPVKDLLITEFRIQ